MSNVTAMRCFIVTICMGTAMCTPIVAPLFAQGTAGPCDVFPIDNPWNVDVSNYPIHPQSQMFIESIDLGSATKRVHPDFGTNPEYGIPYVFVPASQSRVPITYDAY